MLLIINQRCNKVVILLKLEIGGKYIYYKILSEKIGKSVSTIKSGVPKLQNYRVMTFHSLKSPLVMENDMVITGYQILLMKKLKNLFKHQP